MLPERTRKAMLVGLDNNTVITGAFTGGDGVCPMMAAHRAGGRTSCVSFPEAWDKYTGVYGRGITRQATAYEVQTLRQEILASLDTPVQSPLADAIAEHTAMVAERRVREEQERVLAAQPPRRRRIRITGGDFVDLGGAIDEHKSSARRRRSDEATEVGLAWLFEETLVLPDDFGATPATEPEFDFDAAEDDVYAR